MATVDPSRSVVYASDPALTALREVRMPSHLGAPPDGRGTGAPPPQPSAAAAAHVMEDVSFGDESITAAELHTVPKVDRPGESAAERVAQRVRARRIELQERVGKPRVNLYAPEATVTTAAEAADEAAAGESGVDVLAGALMGL